MIHVSDYMRYPNLGLSEGRFDYMYLTLINQLDDSNLRFAVIGNISWHVLLL